MDGVPGPPRETGSLLLRISRFLFPLAVASVPFDAVFRLGIVRLTLTEALFLAAFLFWAVDVARGRIRLEPGPGALPAAAFLAACAVSVIGAQDRLVAVRESLQFAWIFCLLYYMIDILKEKREREAALVLTVAAALVSSFYGLYQYFFVKDPFEFLIALTRLRAHGFFDQPNTFGAYLLGVVPLLLGYIGLADHGHRLRQRIPHPLLNRKLLAGMLLIILCALAATFSRGSWIAFAASMPVLYFLLRRKIGWATVAIGAGISVAAFSFILGDLTVQPGPTDRLNSDRIRMDLAKAGIAVARDHPVSGVGAGNFPNVLQRYASPELVRLLHLDYDEIHQGWYPNPKKPQTVEIVHNTLIQVAAETGLLGLITFCWLFGVLLKQGIDRIRQTHEVEDFYIRSAALTGAIAMLIAGMFGWPFSHGTQELLVFSLGFAIRPAAAAEAAG